MNGNQSTEVEREVLIARVVASLSAEFAQRLLPRALGVQAQVADGESLTDDDAAFLTDMLAMLAAAEALFEEHPDIAALHRCALSLYDDIMTEACANDAPRSAVGY
jgi:hypothetical protein